MITATFKDKTVDLWGGYAFKPTEPNDEYMNKLKERLAPTDPRDVEVVLMEHIDTLDIEFLEPWLFKYKTRVYLNVFDILLELVFGWDDVFLYDTALFIESTQTYLRHYL